MFYGSGQDSNYICIINILERAQSWQSNKGMPESASHQDENIEKMVDIIEI